MNIEWNIKAEELFKVKQARKYYENLEKLHLEALKVLSEGKAAQGERFELKTSERPGPVEYTRIPELHGVNLDIYRKAPTVSWTLTEKITLPEGI